MTETTVAKAQMLIRKPVAQVFEALVDPAITSRFWFSKSSGRLEPGKRMRKRRNLGTFDSREAAEKHERAGQYFKRKG
jgi:uncharacterized protein YndB with AHSA1/START domain